MDFNFRGFFQFTRLWLSESRWTPRRLIILLAFFLFFPLLEFSIWLGFLFDRFFFRGYRQERVKSPVFIIGNPRSGTTLLHRLLAKDGERFTTMQMWEILFAPSITQRKIIRGLASVVPWFSKMLHERLAIVEKGWYEQSPMHQISLSEPEEDDYLLLHIWSALATGLSAGLVEEAIPYTYFDTALPQTERRRIMGFYKRCVQAHLHARRKLDNMASRCYLAKNPALSPKVDTVFEYFPDAKFIYLVRSPLQVIPSYVSMMKFSWRAVGIPGAGHVVQDYVIEMARHWYSYPLQRLERAPDDCYAIVKYDDLVGDPERTVREVYARFDFEIDPTFARVLREESAKARGFRSQHQYVLEDTGLSRQQILNDYREVFERFGFDTQGEADSKRDKRRLQTTG